MIWWRPSTHAILLVVLLAACPALAHAPAEEQIADLSSRIEQQPGDATLYLKRGDQYRYVGEWRHALADYRQSRRIDPNLDVVDLRLGRLHLGRGEPRRAKAALDRYLARRPLDVEALRTRSQALRRLGQPLAAADDLRRAIDTFSPPGRPEPDDFLERARALAAAGTGHLPDAIDALDEGMAVLGPIVSLQIPAIELDLTLGRFDEALRRVGALEAATGRTDLWLARRTEIRDRRMTMP